jgi:hypothetical protein
MSSRAYNPGTDGAWPESSTRWATAPKVIITNADGDWYGYLDGVNEIVAVLKTPSAAFTAAQTARAIAQAAAAAAVATNEARLDTLANQAGKLVLNPSSLPAATAALTALINLVPAANRTALRAVLEGLAEYVARDRFHERAQDKANQ